MKTLVVTSRITFVPDNYDVLINGLASHPNVGGLLILDNLNRFLVIKAVGTFMAGAYAVGRTLSKNLIGNSLHRRKQTYAKYNKPLWIKESINCPSVLELIKVHNFDLIINARTRCIYGEDILSTPRYGCINIHHGLLPEQRGTMCDLWALSEKRDAGFSIHKMTSVLDGGDIIKVVKTSSIHDDNYPNYLARTAKIELETVSTLLKDISINKVLTGKANHATSQQRLFRDPTPAQIKQIKNNSIGV